MHLYNMINVIFSICIFRNFRVCITGKYVVRLFWLGAWRKVYVDDYLPIDKSGNILLPTLDLPKSIPITDLNEIGGKSNKATGKSRKSKLYDHIVRVNYVIFADNIFKINFLFPELGFQRET